jgi:hypothetical protein
MADCNDWREKHCARESLRQFIGMKEEDIREAQLDEDHHTRLRYLSWYEKVDDKWERQTATLHAGETHPILNARKSLENNSRLI